MAFPWASAIAGGSSIVGSIIGAASTAKGIKDTNEANLSIARDNRDWQERMDNTRFQRAKADALAAGFNPLLATGSPAGTPMPSTPVMQNPAPNRGELYLSTAKALSDINVDRAAAKKAEQDAKLTEQSTKSEKLNQRLLRTQIQAMQGAAADSKNRADHANSTSGKILARVKNISGDIGGALSAIILGAGLGGGAKTVASVSRRLADARAVSRFPRFQNN